MRLLELDEVIREELNFFHYRILDVDSIKEHPKLYEYLSKRGQYIDEQELECLVKNKEDELKAQVDTTCPLYIEEIEKECSNISEYLWETDREYYRAINILEEIKHNEYLELSADKKAYYEFMYKNFDELKELNLI